jgi:predicted nucleotidyltransferase component of viral defense system
MTLNQGKHKSILVNILKDIYAQPVIGPILGFKGGTAAYLFYNLDRFSVDLDFDLLDADKEETIFQEVSRVLKSYGNLITADRKKYTLTFVLAYNEKDPGAQNVKVEINRRDFGSRYEIKSYLGISMKVMIPEDMAANKLVAFYERIGKTNRDIYDAWFIFKNNWPINQALIEKRTGMTFKSFLETNLILLEKIDNKSILSGMGELFTESQKDWVRKNLKDDLIFQIKLYIETNG